MEELVNKELIDKLIKESEAKEKEVDNLTEVVQQLWECLNRSYTYNEAKIHMRAFRDGQTTVKELVVKDKEDA
jgi:hypothetical protein